MLHLPIALCVVSCGLALLDTKGGAQLFDQGGHEVRPPVTQQLSRCFENHYKALVEHLRNRLGHLVFCHHSKGIPREMVGHHKDTFHHKGLVQLHHGLDTGVVEMHKLRQSICSNQTEGSPWHLARCFLLVFLFLISSCLKCALVWGNCRERLHVEIFVRVLRSSEVISLILCK